MHENLVAGIVRLKLRPGFDDFEGCLQVEVYLNVLLNKTWNV